MDICYLAFLHVYSAQTIVLIHLDPVATMFILAVDCCASSELPLPSTNRATSSHIRASPLSVSIGRAPSSIHSMTFNLTAIGIYTQQVKLGSVSRATSQLYGLHRVIKKDTRQGVGSYYYKETAKKNNMLSSKPF